MLGKFKCILVYALHIAKILCNCIERGLYARSCIKISYYVDLEHKTK